MDDENLIEPSSKPEKKERNVLVLGAGPAGLACAHALLQDHRGLIVTVLDRAAVPGGAGASFKWKSHVLDYGPHAFHTRGDEPEQLARSLFENDPENLLTGVKKVRVFLMKRFFKYPLRVKEALLKFNPLLSLRIVFEFLLTTIIHQVVSIPVESFEDWGRKRFGSTLYRLSFGNYTRKVWKTDPNLISKRFASEKIQGFSFINILKKMFRVGGQVTEPYYQTWIYPKHGSGVMFERLMKRVEKLGGRVVLRANVSSLAFEGKNIRKVRYQIGDSHVDLEPDFVVNTLALPHFIGLFREQIPYTVRYSARGLRYISLILVYVEFSVERVCEDNWFYLLDDDFISNRVTEQKNISPHTMESGKTVLSFELTCRLGDDLWRMSDDQLYESVLSDCMKVPIIASKVSKISDYTIRRAPEVYESYQKSFENHADVVLNYVQDEIENVATIGRRGMFLQGDMHQSVEMGLALGHSLAATFQNDCTSQNISETKRRLSARYIKYLDHRS